MCKCCRIERSSGSNSVVECDLAKVEVAGSNPVSRSNKFSSEFPSTDFLEHILTSFRSGFEGFTGLTRYIGKKCHLPALESMGRFLFPRWTSSFTRWCGLPSPFLLVSMQNADNEMSETGLRSHS